MSTGHFSSPHDIAKPKLLSSALAFCFKFSLQGYVSCYLARICIAHLSIAGSSLEMTSSHDCFGPQRLSLALRQRTSKYILAGLYIGTLPFGCLELPEAVYLDLQPKASGSSNRSWCRGWSDMHGAHEDATGLVGALRKKHKALYFF